MPTKINQIDSDDGFTTLLRVEGEMMLDDAMLLERLTIQMRSAGPREIVIDLADLDFLDSDAAPILKRLERIDRVSISGIEIFLQSVVNHAERGSL